MAGRGASETEMFQIGARHRKSLVNLGDGQYESLSR